MTRRAALGTLLLLSAGCAWAAPPVQVYGSPTALERLAGQWSGEYVGDASHRRHGSIAFTLKTGSHDAQGDVQMIPEGGSAYQRYRLDDPAGRRAPHTPDQFLSIRFVEIDRDTVRGRLDLYWDPDRDSAATTEFVGRVGDDVIAGTFTTTYQNGDPRTGGHWKVRRTRR